MAEKSQLRQTRERAGLSRGQIAEKLGTTVHHYWQCEMNPDGADPELTARAWKLLGGTEPEVGLLPHGRSHRADVGQPRGQLVWYCRLCGYELTTAPWVLDASHICPKRKGTGTGQREPLVLKID